MDLIREKWLPVILSTGERIKIALSEIFNPAIQDVAYPRADFQGAAWQMLIGILQSAVAPEDEDGWEEIFDTGISPSDWIQALDRLAAVFQFGTEKPAFMQSYEPLESENSSIAGLLIDAPGGNTLKLNKDHFVKRHTVEAICPHCAVMAIYSVQTNSPAGGAGYRVSMRGGGPLTTLVVPKNEASVPLWKKLWLNVLAQDSYSPLASPQQFTAVFPWLAPTKTSEKAGNVVTPENAHLLQAYWGMPRRIELDFTRTRAGQCDLCGEQHDALMTQMRVKNYGVQYDGWLHPFSPYRQAQKDPSAPWLALKGQPGGLAYKDWLGLLCKREDKFNRTQPAAVVRTATARGEEFGLWCFAWDMDNAKPRCWYQQRIPLLQVARLALFESVVQRLILLASGSLTILKNALKSAKFTCPKEAKMDFSMVEIAFWQETEPAFREVLAVLMQDPQRKNLATRDGVRQWESRLHHYLLNVFDRDALTDPDSPGDILLRQLAARRGLESEYRKQAARKDILALVAEQKEKMHA